MQAAFSQNFRDVFQILKIVIDYQKRDVGLRGAHGGLKESPNLRP
jgi:hypothetical protein